MFSKPLFLITIFLVIFSFQSIAQAQCPAPSATNRYVEAPFRAEFANDVSKSGIIKIYYRLSAPFDASKPTLLLINGGPGGDNGIMDSMNTFLPSLSNQFNLVSFDHRGVGCTTPVSLRLTGYEQGFYSMARASNDIEAIRKDLLGPDGKWWVYGVSYGTFLGQQYATLFPSHILGIILDSAFYSSEGVTIGRSQYLNLFIENDPDTKLLFDQVVQRYPDAHNLFLRKIWSNTYRYKGRLAIKGMLMSILNAATPEAARLLYEPSLSSPLTGMTQAIVCEEIWDYPAQNTNYYFHTFEQGCGLFSSFRTPMDFSKSLPNWTTRTMVWAGGFDPVTPVQTGRTIAQLVPGAFLYENALAGHALIAEKPACVEALLIRFINGDDNNALSSIATTPACQSGPKLQMSIMREMEIDKAYSRMIKHF